MVSVICICGTSFCYSRYQLAFLTPGMLKRLGVAILSTSKGVITDKRARKENVGGEVLAFIW